MGKLTLNVNDRSLKQTLARLESAIEDSVDDNTEDMLDAAINRGRKHIRDEEAVWRKEVLGLTMHADFDWTELTKGEQYTIWNSSRHAGIVDEGTEFKKHPSADDLVPWVLDNLNDWHPFDDDGDGDDGTVSVDDSSGGGLDAIAQQVGTVTESDGDGDDDDDVAYSSGELAERNQTGTHNWDIRHNDKNGNPTPFTFEVATQINLDQSRDESGFKTGNNYPRLPDEEANDFYDLLTTVYSDESVDYIYNSHQNWKSTSYDWNGWWLERQVKRTYGIDADLRDSHNIIHDEGSIPPSVAELSSGQEAELEEIYHELSAISSEYLARHVADENGNIGVHRGLRGTQTATVATEFFENPDTDTVTIDDSVIQNYSIDADIKEYFGEGAEVSLTVDARKEALVAPDFVMDGAIEYANSKYRNGEVHIIGGRRNIDIDSVTFSGYNPRELFEKDFREWTTDEHDAVRTVVEQMAEKGQTVTSDEGRDLLTQWVNTYGQTDDYVAGTLEKVNEITGDYDSVDYSDEINSVTEAVTSLDTDTRVTDIIRDQVNFRRAIRQDTSRGTTFARLQENQIGQMENIIKGEFSIDAYETVAGLIEDWKYGPASNVVANLEQLVKDTHDIDAPVRYGNQFSSDFDPIHEDVLNELTQASHEFLSQSTGDRNGNVRLYRGLGTTETAQLGAEILDNQEAEEWELDSTVLMGFALDPGTADYHSEGLELRITSDITEDVVLADDSLLSSQYLPFYDSEVFIVGGSRSYARNAVTMDGEDLDDLLEMALENWTEEQLMAMYGLLAAMAAREQQVTSDAGVQTLENWLDEYQERVDDADDAAALVDEVTN